MKPTNLHPELKIISGCNFFNGRYGAIAFNTVRINHQKDAINRRL
ncbi:hypothetical protein [Nostoc sp. KVJ20]|nr:hypothetical protein [Nostoc sp. KVJ20]